MKVKINSNSYEIPPISELSVAQYMSIVDKTRYTNLISYISALSGVEVDNANVSIKNINVAERELLDVDIDFTKVEAPNIFQDKVVKSLYKENFGSKYVFNLYRNEYNADNIGVIELCLYALSVMLSKEEDYADVESIYSSLLQENWLKALPVGFFILKKSKERKKYLMTSLIRLIFKFKLRPRKQLKARVMITT